MAKTSISFSKIFFVIFISSILSLSATEICFFIPPSDWEILPPKHVKSHVHICFMGKGSKGLRPSINLATEPVQISLDAYVEEVRKIHKTDPNSRWRDLGKFKTLMGEGRLTELETLTESGMARMVQLIVIRGPLAYILTACAHKEEFSKYYKIFDNALHSLQMSSDLVESYSPKKNLPLLKELVSNLEYQYKVAKSCEKGFNRDLFRNEYWQPFEEKIINTFTEMGPYWQILLLTEMQTHILAAEPL